MYSPADTRAAITPAASHAAGRAHIAPDTPHTSAVADGDQERRGNTAAEHNQPRAGRARPPPCPFSLGWGSEKTLHHPLIQDSGHYRWAYGPQYSVEPGGNVMPKSMLIVFTDNC